MNNLNKFGSVVFVESHIKKYDLFSFFVILFELILSMTFLFFLKFACWFSHEKLIKLAKVKVKIYVIRGIDYSQRISR